MSKYAIIASRSLWWKAGALLGATGVLCGAFGAHGLKKRIPPIDPNMLKAWETAAHYQLIHSVALLAAPFARKPHVAGGLFGAGILLFSGSLYAMVLTNNRKLGAITPIGGLMMCFGWLAPRTALFVNPAD